MRHEDKISDSASADSTAVHTADMRETAQALDLAIAQIGTSLRESDDAVERLIGAITDMAGCVHRIEQKLDRSPEATDSATVDDAISRECKLAHDGMQRAVTAFQFYDLLSQRFLHIEQNLKAVADVMRAPDQQHPAMWQHLRDRLSSVYSLEQEQTMYQSLLRGLSAENAIEPADTKVQNSSGDIELF